MKALKVVAVATVLGAAVLAALLLTGILTPNFHRDLTPASVAVLGEGGDPLALAVLFPWAEEGYCSGQFRVTAQETPSRVTISQVRNEDPLFSLERTCAGIGVSGGLASTEVILQSPLANRAVYRAVDGARLAVRR
jgi:hypothetical protein